MTSDEPGNHTELPSITTNDEFAAIQGAVTPGMKRELENPTPRSSHSKKPRDQRLRDCFIITPAEGGGENIICKFCPDYNKTLQKFNPTKSRVHLTAQCTGVDDTLRQILLETTQAAKKLSGLQNNVEGAVEAAGPRTIKTEGPKSKRTKGGRNRMSPAYISFHTDDTSLVSRAVREMKKSYTFLSIAMSSNS